MAKTKGPRTRAYTTRKMSDDLLKRMRILAAYRTAEEDHRVTLEQVVNEVLAKGLPVVERETFER